MIHVEIDVSMTGADAAVVAQWVAECLRNPDTLDRGAVVVVHRLSAEQADA